MKVDNSIYVAEIDLINLVMCNAQIYVRESFRHFLPSSSRHTDRKPGHTLALLVDRRKAFKDSVSISRPVTMTMALVRKTNERPGAPVLTAKMSFSPIASPANVDGAPHYRCRVSSE